MKCRATEKESDSQKERETFHLLIHAPDASNSQGWISQSQDLHATADVGERDAGSGAVITACQDVYNRMLDWGGGQNTNRECRLPGGVLTHTTQRDGPAAFLHLI